MEDSFYETKDKRDTTASNGFKLIKVDSNIFGLKLSCTKKALCSVYKIQTQNTPFLEQDWKNQNLCCQSP